MKVNIETLRHDILSLVQQKLTPVARQYNYSDVDLESQIRWLPIVLVIGNYSSGKSTLINEFIGTSVQDTGQAPTDDCFTVITHGADGAHGVEQRDGNVLLNDPSYPFAGLKKYGQQFASHFRLKQVSAPGLKNLAIIDTPGMLDSESEKDRGYDYQQVIGELAGLADLVLVMFDPHKAGTIKETHDSLRRTLPAKTFDDRVLFVLNRVDECVSLTDFLRVYGTLCWNLSRMTGRKDIPLIHLTFSSEVAREIDEDQQFFLRKLDNQRDAVKEAIYSAPRRRLDNMASFLEIHGERLTHLLEGLLNYRRARTKYFIKFCVLGFIVGALAAAAFMGYETMQGTLEFTNFKLGLYAGVGGAVLIAWLLLLTKPAMRMFHKGALAQLDDLTDLRDQNSRDSWAAVRERVFDHLERSKGKFKTSEVKRDYKFVKKAYQKSSKDIRKTLSRLSLNDCLDMNFTGS